MTRLQHDTQQFLHYVMWLRRLDAGLSPRKIMFDFRPIHMVRLVGKVALRVISVVGLPLSFL